MKDSHLFMLRGESADSFFIVIYYESLCMHIIAL